MHAGLIHTAADTLAENKRLRADAAELRSYAHALRLIYRSNRLLHLRGGSDLSSGGSEIATGVAPRIRSKVASGALPLPPDPPGKCFVGKGTRRPCDACDTIIEPDGTEYELDFAEGRTLRFHVKCYDAWHQAGGKSMTG